MVPGPDVCGHAHVYCCCARFGAWPLLPVVDGGALLEAGRWCRVPLLDVLWNLGAGATFRCQMFMTVCRCRVLLQDVYGCIRCGAWVLVPLQMPSGRAGC